MSAGSNAANAEWDAFFEWCIEHDDVPAVRALLGCMDVLTEVERRNAPARIRNSSAKVYDYLMTEVERIRGSA